MRAVKQRSRGVTVALRGRGSKTVELTPFDWVVNCSGTGKVHAAAAAPIVADAMARGLARPDALGRGLDVTPECSVVGRLGAPITGLFALGASTAGSFLETTSVPDIREQCVAVAERLARIVADGPRERTSLGREIARLRL